MRCARSLPYAATAGDGRKFRDDAQLVVFTKDPDVIVSKPGRDDAEAKMFCILRRNAALDLDTFHAHWLQNHGGMFQRIDELNEPLLAYEQNHGLDLPNARLRRRHRAVVRFDRLVRAVARCALAPHRRGNPDVAYLLDPASIHFVMAGPPTVVIGD